jgi:hypothetical protein
VSSYTYAYAFFQLPYGVIAVTIMSVVTPDLAEKWSTGQETAFLRRMTGGLRAILALVIPSAVGMLLLARPAVELLLGHGHSTPGETATTGAALAMFALGLPGFCAYLYFVRVLQSMQRTKVAFYLYLVENGLNIALALLLVHPLGVRGLALSLSISYTVAALLALATFHQWFGRLADHAEWSPLWRVIIASIPMGIVVVLVSNLSGSTSFGALLVRVLGSMIAGGLTFAAVVIWLGRRHDARRPPPTRDRAGVPPPPVPPRPQGLRLHVEDDERSLVAVDPVETAEPGGVPEPVNAPALVRVHEAATPGDAPQPPPEPAPSPAPAPLPPLPDPELEPEPAPEPEPEPEPAPAATTRPPRTQRSTGASRWVGGRRRVDDAQPVDVGVVRRIGGTKDVPADGGPKNT